MFVSDCMTLKQAMNCTVRYEIALLAKMLMYRSIVFTCTDGVSVQIKKVDWQKM